MNTFLLVLVVLGVQGSDDQFFETLDHLGRIQRNLLQTEEGSGEIDKHTTTTTTTEAPLVLENEAGPTHFYFENGRLPKFLMEVKEGINLTLYTVFENKTKEFDTFILDEEAKGGITGSRIDLDKEDYRVHIDYKGQKFIGKVNGEELTGFELEMNFELVGGTWTLLGLKLINVPFNVKFHTLDLSAVTDKGYAIAAPAGLAFSCNYPGNFRSSVGNETTVAAGLKFPQMLLQVFEVHRGKFGPEWECGELISIGLWVGILVTLAFATICFWGFSMLASINTMDRFDDPKGKSIYIPQTD